MQNRLDRKIEKFEQRNLYGGDKPHAFVVLRHYPDGTFRGFDIVIASTALAVPRELRRYGEYIPGVKTCISYPQPLFEIVPYDGDWSTWKENGVTLRFTNPEHWFMIEEVFFRAADFMHELKYHGIDKIICKTETEALQFDELRSRAYMSEVDIEIHKLPPKKRKTRNDKGVIKT